MAGIIFNIDESVRNSAFNILQEPVKMILENETEAFEKESIIPKVFVMKTTDKYREEYRSTTTMDGFQPTEDMEPANLSDFEEGYSKQYLFQTWTNAFIVSKQTIEDNQLMSIEPRAMGFIKSYGRTREIYAVNLLGAALGKDNLAYNLSSKNGKGMDTVDGTLDGEKQQYFHNKHKTVKLHDGRAQIEQSNKYSIAGMDIDNTTDEDLDAQVMDVIGQIASKMATFKDDKGNIIPCKPTRIVMGEDYRLHDTLVRAMKNKYGMAGESGSAKYEIFVSPYLSAVEGFTDADHAILLIDPERNREGMGATWFDRVSLQVDSYVDKKTKANVWDGRARFGAGFGDFRAITYVNFAGRETTNATTDIKPRKRVRNVKVVQ